MVPDVTITCAPIFLATWRDALGNCTANTDHQQAFAGCSCALVINIRQSVTNTSGNAAASANVNRAGAAKQFSPAVSHHRHKCHPIPPPNSLHDAHKVPAGETKLAFTATGKRIQTNIITVLTL